MSKPLKLCDRVLIDNPFADNVSRVILHPAVGLPSQPGLLFETGFFGVVLFVGVFFCLKQMEQFPEAVCIIGCMCLVWEMAESLDCGQ